MDINEFLKLEEDAQKDYIINLENSEFTSFIQILKKKNLKLAMRLSSFRQSSKNMNKKEIEENRLGTNTKIELYKIKDNPEQPRKVFTNEQINEKMQSIKSRGLITPITVLKKDNHYVLIAGQLRLEAFRRLNQEEKINNVDLDKMIYSTIDVFIKNDENYTNYDIAVDSLVENLNRTDMNVVDIAIALKKLVDSQKASQSDLKRMLGKSKFYISSYLSIANAEQEFLNYILEKEINQPTIVYLILQLNKSIDEKKKLIDKYLNGEVNKAELQKMKDIQNEEIGKTTKANTIKKESNFYDEIFSFKKKFNIKKYEKLDKENKKIVEDKLKQIQKLQEEITEILV